MLFELPSCLQNVFLEVSTSLGRGKLSKRSGGRVDPEGFLLAGLGAPSFIFPKNLRELIQFTEWGLDNGYAGLRVATEVRKILLLGEST